MPNSNLSLNRVIHGDKYDRVEVSCKLCGKVMSMWRSHYYRGDNPCDCQHWRKNYPRLYRIYTSIKTRCYNSNSPNYKNYGERGIIMCDDWKTSFECFKDWALDNGYSNDLTIERVDVNGNYEPLNCTWVTFDKQARNKTNSIRVENTCLRNWCIKHNLNYKLVHQYMKRHPEVSVEEVLSFYLNKL